MYKYIIRTDTFRKELLEKRNKKGRRRVRVPLPPSRTRPARSTTSAVARTLHHEMRAAEKDEEGDAGLAGLRRQAARAGEPEAGGKGRFSGRDRRRPASARRLWAVY